MLRSRMRTLIIVLAALLGGSTSFTTSAYAAEGESTGKKSKTKKNKKKKKKKKSGGSEDKGTEVEPAKASGESPEGTEASGKSKFELLGNIGLSPSPLVGFGATLGLIKDSGSGGELTVSYAAGKSDTIGYKVLHAGGRYRRGLIKVGYVAGGLGLRMASGNWFVLNTTGDAEYAGSASLNAVTLDAAVGAQFKLGSIAIGADLAGFSYPIFKMGVKANKPVEEDYDESDADTQQAKFDKAAAGMHLILLKVGVGFMF